MKLLIFNGSPKPHGSNTEILATSFARGFFEACANEFEIISIRDKKNLPYAVSRFKSEETVLIAFPLYSYSVPGCVKAFIECLEPLCGMCAGKRVGFLVQYGFKEAVHARPIEQYLEAVSALLGCDYVGTIVKGGCDSLYRESLGSKQILNGSYQIGNHFGLTGEFDPDMLKKYSQPEVQKKQNTIVLKAVLKLINIFYWEKSFKKNGVSRSESFAAPYKP